MSETWEHFVEAVARAESLFDAIPPAGDVEQAEGLMYLTRLLASGAAVCMEAADPDYPVFVRMVDVFTRWGIDNPDCLYSFAAVRGDAEYRISGRLGSARMLDIQVQSGHFADAPGFGVVSYATQNELTFGEAGEETGEIDVLLTANDPADSVNTLALDDTAEFVLVRQYFGDWSSETPARFGIERIGASYPPPATDLPDAAARFVRYERWLTDAAAHWAELAAGFMSIPENSMVFIDPRASAAGGGFVGLAYGFGNVSCAPGEAVVVEFEPPDCAYWGFALGDRWWQSFDYLNRQVSLNDAQAQMDDDAKVRIVLSHDDHGVANWLDMSGHTEACLAGRYLLADSAPVPAMQRIRADDVMAVLPPDTPLLTPAERSGSILARRQALLGRLAV